MSDTEFYLNEFSNEIYSLSTPLWAKREAEGGAIMQTWIVKGSERVLAIDSPVPEIAGFREFIEEKFHLPAMMVNTHGHIDHIGCNQQFEEVFLSVDDWSLVAGGGIFRDEDPDAIRKLPFRLENLSDQQVISLGDRNLKVIKIPGHTKGSIVLYEEKTKVLFSGDSIARRVLYGISDWTPLSEFLERLEMISTLEIEKIYSMHDDFSLDQGQTKRINRNIRENLETTTLRWNSPVDGREFKRILLGEENDPIEYFDFVIPNNK